MKNECVKFHYGNGILSEISPFKKYLEKIQFSVSYNSTFSSNQIIGILFVSIYSLNTWLSISAYSFKKQLRINKLIKDSHAHCYIGPDDCCLSLKH